ncbi:hypothetical protein NLI96_g6085 [Meripilus lineatus]|uniref:Uncharacterized protein n=1 Tax=Meripilus lineatus TaxID=2056292 RepID=A0AAD5YIE5_9APHY|nr:hypothetical protein NLI96_g6085 [Physisporinus lineatus]
MRSPTPIAQILEALVFGLGPLRRWEGFELGVVLEGFASREELATLRSLQDPFSRNTIPPDMSAKSVVTAAHGVTDEDALQTLFQRGWFREVAPADGCRQWHRTLASSNDTLHFHPAFIAPFSTTIYNAHAMMNKALLMIKITSIEAERWFAHPSVFEF